MKNRNEDNVVFTIMQEFNQVFLNFQPNRMCTKYKIMPLYYLLQH
jgi:hypothetical protein